MTVISAISLRACRDGEDKPRVPFDDHILTYEKRENGWFIVDIKPVASWRWLDGPSILEHHFPSRHIAPRHCLNTGPWQYLAAHTLWAYLKRTGQL